MKHLTATAAGVVFAIGSMRADAEIVIVTPPIAASDVRVGPNTVEVQFGTTARASFLVRGNTISRVRLDYDGVAHEADLSACASLTAVRYRSLQFTVGPSLMQRAMHAVGLDFDAGVPVRRIHLSFANQRLARMTATDSNAPPDSPPTPLCTPQPLRSADLPPAAVLVERLRGLPPVLGAIGPRNLDEARQEVLRQTTYAQLQATGDADVDALASALRDRELDHRLNAALALQMLAMGIAMPDGDAFVSTPIGRALPALIHALDDPASRMRSYSAQAIFQIGPTAAPAVPALIRLLESGDVGERMAACTALVGIGPRARAALPALRRAAKDPNRDVSQAATRALERVQRFSP